MIFNDLDKAVTRQLCTLATLVGDTSRYEEGLLYTGQQLGASNEEIMEILSEWDDHDVISFKSKIEKEKFVKECFFFVSQNAHNAPENLLYQEVLRALQLYQPSLN
ncbi:hypothetical protein [Marinoscillum sp. MHG1-6]|uniref:hypothetical protein n=1 Tax=Marinoscillum sp. MHG1-6 TaxID=2959627 RepID=UPI002157ED87|nr:hypothetical protein [Marinoscillum sp. MHG1-6]